MKPEIKELWIDALQSGRYKQGKSRLNKDGCFCCLGVLCEVAIENGLPLDKTLYDKETKSFYYGNHDSAYLPISVQEWAGLESDNGMFISKKPGLQYEYLSLLNDHGLTFEDIVEVIKENF